MQVIKVTLSVGGKEYIAHATQVEIAEPAIPSPYNVLSKARLDDHPLPSNASKSEYHVKLDLSLKEATRLLWPVAWHVTARSERVDKENRELRARVAELVHAAESTENVSEE